MFILFSLFLGGLVCVYRTRSAPIYRCTSVLCAMRTTSGHFGWWMTPSSLSDGISPAAVPGNMTQPHHPLHPTSPHSKHYHFLENTAAGWQRRSDSPSYSVTICLSLALCLSIYTRTNSVVHDLNRPKKWRYFMYLCVQCNALVLCRRRLSHQDLDGREWSLFLIEAALSSVSTIFFSICNLYSFVLDVSIVSLKMEMLIFQCKHRREMTIVKCVYAIGVAAREPETKTKVQARGA